MGNVVSRKIICYCTHLQAKPGFQIIQQAWPHVIPYVENCFRNTFDVKIAKYLEKCMISGIHLCPGESPPRIIDATLHEKPNPLSDTVIDCNVSYLGDSSIEFNLAGIPGGLKNIEIQGIVRVILRLNAKPTIYFLDNPKVDFDTNGIAAIPGLKKFLLSKIRSMMVSPTVLTSTSSDSEAERFLNTSESEGSYAPMPELEVPKASDSNAMSHCFFYYKFLSYCLQAFKRIGLAEPLTTKYAGSMESYTILSDTISKFRCDNLVRC